MIESSVSDKRKCNKGIAQPIFADSFRLRNLDYDLSLESVGKLPQIGNIDVIRLEPVGDGSGCLVKFRRDLALGYLVHPHVHIQESQAGALRVHAYKFLLIRNGDARALPSRAVFQNDGQPVPKGIDDPVRKGQKHVVLLEEECQGGVMTHAIALEVTEVNVKCLHEIHEEFQIIGGPVVVALEATGASDAQSVVRLLDGLNTQFFCIHNNNRSANQKIICILRLFYRTLHNRISRISKSIIY